MFQIISMLIIPFLWGSAQKAPPTPVTKIDIDFIMERNAKDAFDLSGRAFKRGYGEQTKLSGFKYGMNHAYTILMNPSKTKDQRYMEISVCLHSLHSHGFDKKECDKYEKIQFQFKPDEQIEIPSKVEHDSRYRIVISEQDVLKNQ